ncbi:MAG: TolC family protein [Acidobacteriia bacterium]|nr:TolC family protein [Terriglobia bacterium]
MGLKRAIRIPLTLAAWLMSLGLLAAPLRGQQAASTPKIFTLQEAVDYALAHYPAVRSAQEQVAAARGGVALARTSYLPRLDSLWQSNRATANNTFGLLLPQSVLTPISGPVLPSTSGRSVWGSAAGLLFTWEPFDFGYRHATVNSARSLEQQSAAQQEVTRLAVATNALDAFFDLLAAEENVRVAEANVRRWQIFNTSVHTLVDNQLRPGADASRADAELARARIQLARAHQQEQLSRAALADALGIAGTQVEVSPGVLVSPPPAANPPGTAVASHPLAVAEQARVRETQAQRQIFQHQYFPRFFLQSGVNGRGSGADPSGSFAAGPNGLGLERANWAVGLTVTFPIFDYFSIRDHEKIAAATERAEAARYDQTIQGVTDQIEQAQAAVEGARQVAANTPIELEAARTGELQSRTRYQSGLAAIVEVAEAGNLLAQAETDDALARLAVWHNLGSLAAAQGDLKPFFRLAQGEAGGH